MFVGGGIGAAHVAAVHLPAMQTSPSGAGCAEASVTEIQQVAQFVLLGEQIFAIFHGSGHL